MKKRILGLIVCILMASSFSVADAHGTFTWFGLRKNNTEVTVKSSDCNSGFWGWARRCDCDDKHKHKPPKPKHKKKHKPPKHKQDCKPGHDCNRWHSFKWWK